MKHLHLCFLFAVSAAQLGGSSTASAQDGSPPETRQRQEFCYALIASGLFPDLNLGECMSFNSVSDQGFIAHVCDQLRETGELGDMTYAQCVRSLREDSGSCRRTEAGWSQARSPCLHVHADRRQAPAR